LDNTEKQAGSKATIALMESVPVEKAIVKLALPTVLGMIVQSVYNLTDTFFIGMTGDPNLVAGISLAFPLFMIVQGLGSMFATGSASYISRKLGEKDYDEARRANSVTFYTTFVIGATTILIMFLLKDGILRISGTSEATFGPTDDYFTVIVIGSIFMIQNISMQGQVRSEGRALQAMIGMLLGIVVNIVLDPVFILVLDWGTGGAAWATVIGAFVSCVYFVIFFNSKKTLLSLKLVDLKPNKTMYAEILKIGIPAGMSHIVMSACAVINNVYAAGFGDHVVAGAGVNMRIGSLAFMLVMGISTGFQPFAGYNYGSGNYKRLLKGLKFTVGLATGASIFFSAVFALFGRELISLFIDDGATVEAGTRMLLAFVIGMPFGGIQLTLSTTFQALGKPIRALIVMMGRQCLFFIPLLLFLTHYFGFDGYIYTQPISDIATSAVSVLLGITLFKNLKRQMEH
jgi:putative MATE family efflux protein